HRGQGEKSVDERRGERTHRTTFDVRRSEPSRTESVDLGVAQIEDRPDPIVRTLERLDVEGPRNGDRPRRELRRFAFAQADDHAVEEHRSGTEAALEIVADQNELLDPRLLHARTD